uniref:Uncharacterized protein n=1 Tax=Anguilla anguilla TaxID=7936 RepID=A0A0E9SDK6_ANGAN
MLFLLCLFSFYCFKSHAIVLKMAQG